MTVTAPPVALEILRALDGRRFRPTNALHTVAAGILVDTEKAFADCLFCFK